MDRTCTTISEAVPLHKQAARLARARLAVDRICESIKSRTRYINGGVPVLNWYFSSVVHSKASTRIPAAARFFAADEQCNGCGVCAKVCPMRNITMNEGKPLWQERYEQCYACLQWCQKEAIQVAGEKTSTR